MNDLKHGKTGKAAVLIVLQSHQDEATAYRIARLTGYSPQHINRVLKEMWRDGISCYRVVNFRNGDKRIWGLTEKWSGGDWVSAGKQETLQW